MYSKFFLTLCACAVLGTACKKDDNNDPKPSPTPTPEAKEYTGNFRYNGQNSGYFRDDSF